MRWQFWLIFLPLAVVVIALSVVNRDPVTFSIGFGSAWQVPLFLLLLAGALLGILFGGIGAWLAGGNGRRRGRHARAEAATTRDELENLRRKNAALAAELERARGPHADDGGAPALAAPRDADAA
ncbi:MAG: lipopolysaccharide assembly protein LapA domain-containing protein [Sneathiellaceae bacterium]